MGFFNFLDKLFNYDPNEDFKETMLKQQQEKFEIEDKKGVRDKIIISKSFFEKQIEQTNYEIQLSKNSLKEVTTKDEKFDTYLIYDSFNGSFLNLVSAKYSKGEKIKDILPYCDYVMETVNKIWSNEIDYSDGGDTNFLTLENSLCIGILAGVDKFYFEDLAKVMQEKNFSDFVVDYLVNSQLPDYPIGKNLIVKDEKALNFLVEIIKTDDKEEAQNKIKIYLEKHYYTAQNLDYFYNTHSIDKGENYHGYWCWEAAALVKIKNLDDSNFKNNKYYPYDFVHWDKQEPPKKNTFLID